MKGAERGPEAELHQTPCQLEAGLKITGPQIWGEQNGLSRPLALPPSCPLLLPTPPTFCLVLLPSGDQVH